MSPELQAAEQRFYQQIASDLDGTIQQYRTRFGNVIDRDNARELFLEYSQSRESRQELGAATYRPAGLLTDEIYRREVVKPDPDGYNLVIFNAGGPGVGKSTFLCRSALGAQFAVDGTLSNFPQGTRPNPVSSG